MYVCTKSWKFYNFSHPHPASATHQRAMNTFQKDGVLGGEQMHLTLDYAWYHFFFCVLQAAVLWYYRRTKHFHVAHCFGLFAWAMDYGLMYLKQGKRTVSYPDYHGNIDNGFETLGPIGHFVFFFWFDYAAFGVVLWAFHFRDHLSNLFKGVALNLDIVDCFSFLIVPIQFWTAPLLAGTAVSLDSRVLVLARSSPKMTYALAVPIFAVLLKLFDKNITNRDIFAIALSGFGCGCVHHLALFTFGLRGYSNYAALALTLLTEWPALIFGCVCISNLGGNLVAWTRVQGSLIFRLLMWLLLGTFLAPYLSAMTEEDMLVYLMPYVPGQHMQSLGTFFLRTQTCRVPLLLPKSFLPPTLNCWDIDRRNGANDGTDMLVMASAAKSGAVLSARIVAEVGTACGYCVASGERSRAGIPGPIEELPTYDGLLLHAIINMRTWPEYVSRQGFEPTSPKLNQKVRCVTTLRDPMSRLKSLYLYARSGGEAWFRYQSGLMQELGNPKKTLQESILFFWNTFGRDYLIQSHEYMVENLRLGCVPMKMEGLKKDFDGHIGHLLHVFGVRAEIIPELVKRLASADLSRKTLEQRQADPHVTANKFSKILYNEMIEIFNSMEEVQKMVRVHRKELGYE